MRGVSLALIFAAVIALAAAIAGTGAALVLGIGMLAGLLLHKTLFAASPGMDSAYTDSAYLAAIIDSSDDAIISKDLNGIVQSWNPAAERLTGYSASEMIGKPITTIIPEDRLHEEEGILRRINSGERIGHMETVRVSRGGRILDVSVTISPVRDRAGRIIGASKILRDISRHRQSERALREAETQFRRTFENAAVGIANLNSDGRWVGVNEHFCRMLGYTREELLKKSVAELTHPDDQEVSRIRYEAMERGEIDHYSLEKRYLGKDGQAIWVHLTVAPERDENGRMQYCIGVVQDITDRKRAEDALRSSEERFRAVLENSLDAAYRRDLRTDTYDYLSPVIEQVMGIDRISMQTLPVEGLIARVHPEDRENLKATIRLGMISRSGRAVYRFQTNEGEYRWVADQFSVQVDDEGRPQYRVGIVRDVTLQKAAEEELERRAHEAAKANAEAQQAKSAAEEASRAKDHFLAVLSHELRTPLTPVIAALSLLESDDRIPDDVRSDLAMVQRNVELETRLIDDLLDLTRVSRGKIVLEKRPVAICDLIEHVTDICGPDLQAKQIRCELEICERPARVMGDAARLQQVFWNILKNAVKFTPVGGRITIRLWVEDGQAVAEVRDTGRGIEPNLLPRLFRSFEQGGLDITRQFGGLGLGLAICKMLVDLHAGSISAHSEGIGKGATFRVRLPLAQEAALAAAEGPLVAHKPAASAGRSELHVLLVEDHVDTARVMQRFLKVRGHTVTIAGDVASALLESTRQRFDLIISDLGLPDRSGLELIRELRSGGLSIPAIALSGYGQEDDVQRSREAGFSHHLVKPVDIHRLQETIERCVCKSC